MSKEFKSKAGLLGIFTDEVHKVGLGAIFTYAGNGAPFEFPLNASTRLSTAGKSVAVTTYHVDRTHEKVYKNLDDAPGFVAAVYESLEQSKQ